MSGLLSLPSSLSRELRDARDSNRRSGQMTEQREPGVRNQRAEAPSVFRSDL
jgi:hypothetical protein